MDQNQSGSVKNEISNGVNLQKFPKGFLFGAAASSHQVEGSNINDWSEWEKENAERLSKRSGYPPENHISGRAANQYKLYESDLDLAKQLGFNAYRFSIEWSRIEPEEGQFDEQEIEHYKKLVQACRNRGIEPFVTLWHWPIPLWLRDKGGWKNKKVVDYFGRYTQKVVENLSDVKFWITLNEPENNCGHSYLLGQWPPQEKNIFSYLRALHNLIDAHKNAYQIIKKINPALMVGIAKHSIYYEGNKILASPEHFWMDEYFLNKISRFQDFIGLNYYFHRRILRKADNEKVSDMGWELYPRGIYYLLKELSKYKKPIYITEHGLADAKDVNRAWYIEESLKWVAKALSENINVKGYLHWSLIDNFEWAEGFWPRFGLIEVDYKNNFKRTIRPSAQVYAELIKKHQ